ncbi:MAG: protein kinase [Planctomycetes bacterium]|nr:protein kinase [Planctomycetota bacterium]
MTSGDDDKTRRIDTRAERELEPTIASTRAEGTGNGSSTEVNQPADRFTLTQVLGEGTQGEVCKAFDNLLHRHVAIKFPHRVDDDRVAQDILSEARKAARLNHPNVVTIYEVGFWKGRPFIAMELVEGVSLSTILKECGRISVDRYLQYARQILKALGAAHRSGLIHRDLKPHNVLLSAEGTLKLTDFGVAHVGSGVGADKTVQFKIAGTPAYMAPEQWSGLTPDARSDIYAFGCMSFKLLTGHNVFPAEDTMRHHLESKPRSIRTLAPNVPEALERILMRCLEKRPEDRWQSSKDLLEAIEGAATKGKSGSAGYQAGETGSPRKRQPVLLYLLVLVLAGAAGFLYLVPSGKELRARLEAKFGLGDEKPRKPEVRPEPEPPEVDPRDEERRLEAERLEAERERLRQEGMQALAAARDLAGSMDVLGIDERIRLATMAADRLAGSPEADEARRIVSAGNEDRAKLTENKKIEAFTALLDRARKEVDDGRLDAAADTIREAEMQKEVEPVLAKYGKDLALARLPLAQGRLRESLRAARFGEARRHCSEAAKLLDSLGRSADRDEQLRDERSLQVLDQLDRNSIEQPRFVVVTLDGLDRDLERFPTAHLIEARAWLSLGGHARCRTALEALLAAAPDPEIETEARAMLSQLPRN